MKISGAGEFALIKQVSRCFESLLPKGATGIGDDCAVLPKNAAEVYIVSCDMLLDGVHFYKDKISPYDLGYKSLAVNLSDIAAMGGAANIASFLSLAVPPETNMRWIKNFFAGYKSLAEKHGVALCGGDMSAYTGVMINVTVMGTAKKNRLRFRNTAKVGDVICCTLPLGDSAGGFRLIQQSSIRGKAEEFLINAHYRPAPELAAAVCLAGMDGVHAMMDISDGLISDLQRITSASGCGAVINTEDLPISQQLKVTSDKYGWDTTDLAVNGGEDYCLLFTADAANIKRILARFEKQTGRPFYIIGGITKEKGRIRLIKNGKKIKNPGTVFKHF